MSGQETHRASGEQLSQITTALVKLHHDFYGKGPTEAKSYAVDDTIVCIFKGGFTKVEETLLAAGNGDAVEQVPRRFQAAMKEKFIEGVESAIDRKVIGYMSQISAEPQVAVEIFLLEPHSEELLGKHAARFDDS